MNLSFPVGEYFVVESTNMEILTSASRYGLLTTRTGFFEGGEGFIEMAPGRGVV